MTTISKGKYLEPGSYSCYKTCDYCCSNIHIEEKDLKFTYNHDTDWTNLANRKVLILCPECNQRVYIDKLPGIVIKRILTLENFFYSQGCKCSDSRIRVHLSDIFLVESEIYAAFYCEKCDFAYRINYVRNIPIFLLDVIKENTTKKNMEEQEKLRLKEIAESKAENTENSVETDAFLSSNSSARKSDRCCVVM